MKIKVNYPTIKTIAVKIENSKITAIGVDKENCYNGFHNIAHGIMLKYFLKFQHLKFEYAKIMESVFSVESGYITNYINDEMQTVESLNTIVEDLVEKLNLCNKEFQSIIDPLIEDGVYEFQV